MEPDQLGVRFVLASVRECERYVKHLRASLVTKVRSPRLVGTEPARQPYRTGQLAIVAAARSLSCSDRVDFELPKAKPRQSRLRPTAA
jgi:hypothetical protein